MVAYNRINLTTRCIIIAHTLICRRNAAVERRGRHAPDALRIRPAMTNNVIRIRRCRCVAASPRSGAHRGQALSNCANVQTMWKPILPCTVAVSGAVAYEPALSEANTLGSGRRRIRSASATPGSWSMVTGVLIMGGSSLCHPAYSWGWNSPSGFGYAAAKTQGGQSSGRDHADFRRSE
jgi:hypothetical protein